MEISFVFVVRMTGDIILSSLGSEIVRCFSWASVLMVMMKRRAGRLIPLKGKRSHRGVADAREGGENRGVGGERERGGRNCRGSRPEAFAAMVLRERSSLGAFSLQTERGSGVDLEKESLDERLGG
jgi:hypothetical protein